MVVRWSEVETSSFIGKFKSFYCLFYEQQQQKRVHAMISFAFYCKKGLVELKRVSPKKKYFPPPEGSSGRGNHLKFDLLHDLSRDDAIIFKVKM